MSVVVSSSTDSQEAVNAAAGIAPQQSEAPPKTPETEPEPDGDPESPDESEEEEPEQEQPSKKGGFQRRIDRFVRDKHQLIGRVRELERQLERYAAQPQPLPPQPDRQAAPQRPPGPPRESDYPTYEGYLDARDNYNAQKLREELRQEFLAEQHQRAIASQVAQTEAQWHGRVREYSQATPDFAATLSNVDDIQIPPHLRQTLLEHERGPELSYQLAKHREELEEIVSLPPGAALRRLGGFETRYLNGNTSLQPKASASSKAPPPINPIGSGSTGSTKSPDEMSFQEYKRWRKKNGAR